MMMVMHVRHVRMRVAQPAVSMEMRMRFARRIRRLVRMTVMLVMDVRMGVRSDLVNVLVFVMLGDVQPNANGHQNSRDDKLDGERFAQSHNGRGTADERGCCKIRSGPRGPKMSKSKNEQSEAHAVSEKSDDPGDNGGGEAW